MITEVAKIPHLTPIVSVKEIIIIYRDAFCNFGNNCRPSQASYSEEDLCNRLDNDHNLFAVCRQLFHPADDFGLNAKIPQHILDRFPDLIETQHMCYTPSTPKKDVLVDKLIAVYSAIIAS